MAYQTEFADIAYPDESGRPCALLFRIAITATAERLAVIHLRHVNPNYQSPMSSYIVRDQILNRILDDHLRGLPVKSVRLVVQGGDDAFMFQIDVDYDDYIKRRNPHESSSVTTGRGLITQHVKIRSESVLAGLTRVHTGHGQPIAVPKDIARALR
ncbi:hypothetical protein [Paraburkholderia hospita]|uniref:hypothetical protein n=1 Tax=Paraburkholderia hospita TaxID=169430 RepID=UPI000B8A2BB3|nr:hypothetical protein [Paraburkholderia hospita]